MCRNEQKKSEPQTFLPAYCAKFSFIQPSKLNKHSAKCTYCMCEIDISHGGSNDIKKHEDTEKHKKNARLVKSTAKLNFGPPVDKEKENLALSVTRAETTMSLLICEMNLSLSAANTLSHAFKHMFPDSTIAKQYKSCRNKATALVDNLASDIKSKIIQAMKSSAFTLSTDGSNDQASKQFPMVIRTCLGDAVRSEHLCVPTYDGSATGERIFSLIDDIFKKHDIPWENCISFGSDNANVMVGREKGVYGYLLKKIHLCTCLAAPFT